MGITVARPRNRRAAGPGPGSGPAGSLGRADFHWPLWWASFLSLSCFNLAIGFGPVLMVLFLLTWGLYFLAWPARSLDAMLRAPLLWAFPLLALLSMLWSQVPGNSVRNAVQLMVVTGIGILIARAQNPRSFISSFMCAMILTVALGTAAGGTAAIGIHGDSALIGIFGSKNNFALMISFMMLFSAAVLLDRGQPLPLRLIGLAGFLAGLPLLVQAKSLGALLSLAIALGCLGVFSLAGRLSARARPPLYLVTLVLALAAAAMLAILASSGVLDALLQSAGKDTTLTGRTYLWSRAEQMISLRPLFGTGYQAFWVQEYVEAEGLWRIAKITSRYGFHFHNLYYAAAVELGYAGAVVLGATLAGLLIKALVATFRQPRPESAVIVAVCVIFLIRAYVELDFISPFAIGTLLLPILWIYATAPAGPRPALRPAAPCPASRQHIGQTVGQSGR